MMLSEDEIRRELRRLEFKASASAARNMHERASYYKSDAEMLRWVLDDEEGETA